MPFIEVKPIIDLKVRGLCAKPYPLHPKGCPNFNHKMGCPPQAPKLDDFFDLSLSCYVIWNAFAIGEHVRSLKEKHPDWSERQLYCCLYWQPRARADLEAEIEKFIHVSRLAGARWVTRCPEAMGLNVTATMRSIGVELEWPPKETAVQVAFAGVMKAEPEPLAPARTGQLVMF